ncbi:MAG: hypothetical protein ABIT04_08535 [Novosphingobium sp.]
MIDWDGLGGAGEMRHGGKGVAVERARQFDVAFWNDDVFGTAIIASPRFSAHFAKRVWSAPINVRSHVWGVALRRTLCGIAHPRLILLPASCSASSRWLPPIDDLAPSNPAFDLAASPNVANAEITAKR